MPLPEAGAPEALDLHASAREDRSTAVFLSSWACRYRTIAFISVLLGGGLLRFAGLGKESIWLDEATSLIIARMDLPSVIAWAAADVHPPLYYMVLHFWLRLGETEYAIRALSAVFGVLTIVTVYSLACDLLGQRAGILSALLLALAPLHIWYCQEARMYVMVTMLSLLASRLLLLGLRSDAATANRSGSRSIRYWLAYVLVSALALYTHYFALFAWFFSNLFALYWLWRRRSSQWRRWLTAQAVTLMTFLPWVPILLRQVTTGGGGWVERSLGRPSPYSLLDTWLSFSVGPDSQVYPLVLRRFAYGLFAICAAAALYRLWRVDRSVDRTWRRQEGLLFCVLYSGLSVLAVWLLSQVKPMYSTRYLLIFLPGYCMLIAAGLGQLPGRGARQVATLVLVLTLLVGNWHAWRVEQNADWRGVASYVANKAEPGDVVLFSPRWNVKPFEYYSRGSVDNNMDLPIPVTLEAANRVVSDIAERHKRVWLVWQEGHYSDVNGLAKQVLDSQYSAIDGAWFRGVDQLMLYALHGYGDG